MPKKINRRQLRRIILNEIKRLNEDETRKSFDFPKASVFKPPGIPLSMREKPPEPPRRYALSDDNSNLAAAIRSFNRKLMSKFKTPPTGSDFKYKFSVDFYYNPWRPESEGRLGKINVHVLDWDNRDRRRDLMNQNSPVWDPIISLFEEYGDSLLPLDPNTIRGYKDPDEKEHSVDDKVVFLLNIRGSGFDLAGATVDARDDQDITDPD